MRPKLTYANVVATLALFIAIGGASAFAASQLGKNSVGSKQLKKNAVTAAKLKMNAVTTAKLRNEAVTAQKIKKGTLTGAQIDSSTLGPVPVAESANTATVASSLPPAEAWHEVGTPGEPGFLNNWENLGGVVPTAAFYKDNVGTVHLRGEVKAPTPAFSDTVMFILPPGFRPTRGMDFAFTGYCVGGELCGTRFSERIDVLGGDYGTVPEVSGAVDAGPTNLLSLNGITFRAES
jgi:hypothetical protein